MHRDLRSGPRMLLVAGLAVGLAALGCNCAGKSSNEMPVPSPVRRRPHPWQNPISQNTSV